ncbi:uncharacterized protein LOC128680442 [Plodia interpunctella]|uniref:uncharacterized protein LOC128680442 n=1 Tax=Plodia interpunctella TaxID=58824 RepID=UPI0023680569|nr:uncharacterized protein LOC128680442 [Plodia interpunctella]
MYTIIGIAASVLIAIRLRKLMGTDSMVNDAISSKEPLTNGGSGVDRYWDFMKNQYIIPMGHTCISYCYGLYLRFSFLNLVIFMFKYVPTCLYMYKFLKKIYITSRERIKQKQIEMEDIQLQIQIVDTKICVRDAEFTERADLLRRGAERLCMVRSRVRNLIAADDSLQRALNNAALNLEIDVTSPMNNTAPEQDRAFLIELLKDLKYDHDPILEKPDMDCGENPQSVPISDNSVYSTISDGEQDCHVKIVRVTNVYKVAYLRHYIKQKRLRRANKQAILKKKIENIKKLLEDWQKSLNMVINSKLNVLNRADPRAEDTSQEAMGDYSKPTLRESSNSDSDLRNGNDMYDDYWPQNPYHNYPYEYEDLPDMQGRDYCELHDVSDYSKYQSDIYQPYESSKMSEKLSTLLEETKSQILFEDSKSNCGDDGTCHDLIQL